MKAEKDNIKIEGTPSECKEFFGVCVACNKGESVSTRKYVKSGKYAKSKRTNKHWTPAEDELKQKMRGQRASSKQIAKKLRVETGTIRTRPAILTRCSEKGWVIA